MSHLKNLYGLLNLKRARNFLILFGPLFLSLFTFQNCKEFHAEDQVTEAPASEISAAERINFSKAILDQPATLFLKTPGSSLNETVVIDEDTLSELLSEDDGKSHASQKAAVSAPKFIWKNETTKKVVSEDSRLKLENLDVKDSARYQLYVQYKEDEKPVPNKFFDVFISSIYEVPLNSVKTHKLQPMIISQTADEQVILIKILHDYPGQIKSVAWFRGDANNPQPLPELDDLKSIVITKDLREVENETVSAKVIFGDQSEHLASVTIPLADPEEIACLRDSNCKKVCEEPKITNLADNSGKKIEQCIADGLKLAPPIFICRVFGSTFDPGKLTCKCPDGTTPSGKTCTSGAETDIAKSPSTDPLPLTCTFGKNSISAGATVTGFTAATVPFGQTCKSETRTCQNGTFGSGQSLFPSCDVEPPKACQFNGKLYSHETTITAFASETVPFGQSCTALSRTCNNGTLTGSGEFASCRILPVADCPFAGGTVIHNTSITAYSAAEVPFGQTCQSETRSCNNGNLSGSFAFRSCASAPPEGCVLDGHPIANGASIDAFNTAVVPFGGTCTSQKRICSNGVLSGKGDFASCKPRDAEPCPLDGKIIDDGTSGIAFQSKTVPFGEKCKSESRTCNRGLLTGSFAFSTCAVTPPVNCSVAGQTVVHGKKINVFKSKDVLFDHVCAEVESTRTCNNGNLSGIGEFLSCVILPPVPCSFNGQRIEHLGTVTAFQSSTVPFGSVCSSVQETRSCYDGKLSGTGAFGSCETLPPSPCTFGSQIVPHGGSVTGFQSSTVPFGSSCSSVQETRSCFNGSLSGSAPNESCSVVPPANCNFNGTTITHGGTVTAFPSATVPFGQTCNAETRSCNNGTLSGSATNTSCTVEVNNSCINPDFGSTMANGAVQVGSMAGIKTRWTCANGVVTKETKPSCSFPNTQDLAVCGLPGRKLLNSATTTSGSYLAVGAPTYTCCLKCESGSYISRTDTPAGQSCPLVNLADF